MINGMVHLDKGEESFIAMSTSVCVNNGNLFITCARREHVLVGDSLVYFLTPGIDGWYIPTGKVVLRVIIVVTNGESSVRRYVITAKAEVRMYIFAFRCSEYGESHVPCSDVFRCISFTSRCTRYEHLVSFGALVS